MKNNWNWKNWIS